MFLKIVTQTIKRNLTIVKIMKPLNLHQHQLEHKTIIRPLTSDKDFRVGTMLLIRLDGALELMPVANDKNTCKKTHCFSFYRFFCCCELLVFNEKFDFSHVS